MALPNLPSLWLIRRRAMRWLRSLVERFDPRGLVALLLGGILLWVVAAMPLEQTVEGTVQTSAISFDLRPSTQDGSAEGDTDFLAETVRELRISGLRDGTPVSFLMKEATVRLDQGQQVAFKPLATETFGVKLQLPPGTRVENLHGEAETLPGTGPKELVMDLRSPTGTRSPRSTPVALILTPPAAPEERDEAAVVGQLSEPISGLKAVQTGMGGSERNLPTPDGTFSLLLEGDARLRLRLRLTNPTVVFEPDLPVREVKFSTVKRSAFGRKDLLLSNVREGTLHYGRREPLQLRANQFLRMEPPGIEELTDLRLVDNALIVLISGQTHRLSTGLSPNRASTELNGTLLSRYLSPEQITSFYSVLAGVIGSMVVVIFRAY